MTTEVRLALGMYADKLKGHRLEDSHIVVVPTYDPKSNIIHIPSRTTWTVDINFQKFKIIDKGRKGTTYFPLERPQDKTFIPSGEKRTLNNGIEVENIK